MDRLEAKIDDGLAGAKSDLDNAVSSLKAEIKVEIKAEVGRLETKIDAMDGKFETKFDAMQKTTQEKFDGVNKALNDLDRHFKMFMGLVGALLVAVLGFFGTVAAPHLLPGGPEATLPNAP